MAWSILQKNGLIRHSGNLSHPVITHPNGFEPRQLGTVASSWNNPKACFSRSPTSFPFINGIDLQSFNCCWILRLKLSCLDWNNFATPQSIHGCWISGLKISWLDWNNFAAPQSIQGCWISGLKISWLDWNNFAAPQSIQRCWISGLKLSWLDLNNFAAPQSIQRCWISGLKLSCLDWNNFAAPQSNLQVREDQKKWYDLPYLSNPGYAMIAVTLDKVTYTYVSIPIVADLSWEIHDNRTVGLVGPNGSGKSTLLGP